MNEIKAAIFDVGGVLCNEGLQAMLVDMKTTLNIDEATLSKIFASHIPLIGSGKIEEAEFWEQVSKTYSTRKVDVSENLLGRAYADSLKPQTEVLEVVKTLGEGGINLAILSNTIEQHAQPLRAAGVYSEFDDENIFLSHEIGLRKPSLEVYEFVLRRLGIDAPEAIFVDDRADNVGAAIQLGMHGIVFEDAEKLEADIQVLLPDFDFSK